MGSGRWNTCLYGVVGVASGVAGFVLFAHLVFKFASDVARGTRAWRAAIRRFVVANAASEELGRPKFDDLMMELRILIGAVLVLGFTIWLLRHSRREPIGMDEEAEETGGPASEEVSEGEQA